MHSSWMLAGLMGVLALIASVVARARWRQRHAPILLEERPIPRRNEVSRGTGWEW